MSQFKVEDSGNSWRNEQVIIKERENCSGGVNKFRFLAPLEWNPQTRVCWSLHRDRRLSPGTPFVVVLGHNRLFLWPNTLILCWITSAWFPWRSDISSFFPQWQQCQGGGRIGLSWDALRVFPMGRISCTIPQVYCLYFCCSPPSVDPLSRRTEITDEEQTEHWDVFTCNKFEAMSSSVKFLLLCDYLGTVWAQTLKCWIPSSFPFFLINWLYNKQGSWNLHVEMIKVIQLFFKTLWIVEGNSHCNVEALH